MGTKNDIFDFTNKYKTCFSNNIRMVLSNRSRRFRQMKQVERAKALRDERYQLRQWLQVCQENDMQQRQNHEKGTKRVVFRHFSMIVLIPSMREYDDQLKSRMWWSNKDYDTFFFDFMMSEDEEDISLLEKKKLRVY